MSTIRPIALVGYEGVATLDLVGPLDVFGAANAALAALGAHDRYRIEILAPDGAPFTSERGLTMLPHRALDRGEPFDTIIIPGGPGLRVPAMNGRVAAWIMAEAPRTRRIASVCTGLYGLAATGLLDGRRATTHWAHAKDAARKFPAVHVEADAIFIADGPFYTAAGVTASIDLALALVEADHGPALALTIARDLVVYVKRDGDQTQYSEPLRFQTETSNRFADLVAWMRSHLADDLTVERLADRVHLSPRHFTRAFRAAFDASPRDYVEALRLEAALDRLALSGAPLETIAHSIGFKSEDAFRRMFDRRMGIPPALWRRRFSRHTLAQTQKGTDHADA